MPKYPMESRIASTSCGAVEYTLLGKGPVVLVSHGTSSNCFSVDGSKPLLEAGFSVLTPSRPGYGRTPLKIGTSAAQAAEVMVALLDTLEIETCSVQAISGGGPTGLALAANHPERVRRLALAAAITRPETRASEPAYQTQKSFYGPLHGLFWNLLGLISRFSPAGMARQTMAIFSTHDPDEVLKQLTAEDIAAICRFYQRHSSRQGAANDLTHMVGEELLQKVHVPALIIHSPEDKSVPFEHAEWALAHLPQAELCQSGVTGHFYWVGPDYVRVGQTLTDFFHAASHT